MKQLKTILVAVACLLSVQSARSQSAVYGGLSMLNVKYLSPTLGAFTGFESGNKNMKWSVGFNSSLIRFNISTYDFYASEIKTGNLVKFKFNMKSGYMAIPIMYKYYFMNPEKTRHNLFLGVGVALQIVSQYEEAPGYDESLYFTNEHFTNKHIKREGTFAFTSMIGYQYAFKPRFALTTHIGYDLNFQSARHLLTPGNGIYQTYYNMKNVNLLTVGVGLKYTFKPRAKDSQ